MIFPKGERSTQINIDREAKTTSKTVHLEKRMEPFDEGHVFASLEDYIQNFKHNTKCPLFNASKSEMGILSKKLLEEINNKLNNHLCYNQWCSTSTVIEWFRTVEKKKNL